MENVRTFTAFAGDKLIISGDLRKMLLATKKRIDQGESATILIFEDQTGNQIDFGFHGTPEDVLTRLSSHPLFASTEPQINVRTGPGRPKLGVVSHEVTLLPRHWDWLGQQPGGASVTLRKLVEEARKRGKGRELARNSWDAAGKFMWVMAGNLSDFEEASRALYAKDSERLQSLISKWPEDIRMHLEKLVEDCVRLEEKVMTENQTKSPSQGGACQ